MRFSQHSCAIRLSMGAGVVGLLLLTTGCDSGSAPDVTPADIDKSQKNEMEARQKAFGKQTYRGANSAKAAKAQAGATGDAAAPAEAAPAKDAAPK